MRLLDEIYTEHPYYGTRRMAVALKHRGHEDVGRDLIRTLMRRMGLEAVYAKPNLSRSNPEHKIYPYLLRGVKIDRIDQVWSTDITYVRLKNGFMYLTAVIDWFSRYVLAWKLSNSLDGIFCREVLLEALEKGKPEIFNTDQGAQYTCERFVEILLKRGIQPSMDGRGRALDNIFSERLWRTVKQENVYLNDYQSGIDAYLGIEKYFLFYNYSRPHMSLKYEFPGSVYWQGRK
jgi:putative transposase